MNDSQSEHYSLWFVNAFTDVAFAGNPACVTLLAEPPEQEWMPRIAVEFSRPINAFAWQPPATQEETASYEVRLFSPTQEVRLSGDDLLSTDHALWSAGLVG